MLTDNTRKHLKDGMTKKQYMSFTTLLCPFPEKCLRAPVRMEMDRQLVASYFTVKSTDIFCTAYILINYRNFLLKSKLIISLFQSVNFSLFGAFFILINKYHAKYM